MKTLFLHVVLSLAVYGRVSCGSTIYRFDYEWNDEAAGWLKYHAVPATWEDARLRCHAEGAVLASPITSRVKLALIQFVKKRIGASSEHAIFTGVHATFSRGDYSSVEGVPLLRLEVTWAPGEPDNHDNSERCLEMRTSQNGVMADTRCDKVLPYVCYKKEVPLMTSVCDTSDKEDGYKYEPRTGSCYKFHKTGLHWSDAYMTCYAEGGYLAVINNKAEAAVIQDIISRHAAVDNLAYNNQLTSVGYHDWGHYGTNFMTIHGETLESTYNVWGSGEPNNLTLVQFGSPGESCGSVRRNATLNDIVCTMPTAFLCEKEPNSLSNSHPIPDRGLSNPNDRVINKVYNK